MLACHSHKNNYGFNQSKIILDCEKDVAEMLVMANLSSTRIAKELVGFIEKEYNMTVNEAYDIITPDNAARAEAIAKYLTILKLNKEFCDNNQICYETEENAK